jgi:hypothetical protein
VPFIVQHRNLRGPSKQPVMVSIQMNANYRRLRVTITETLAQAFGWKKGDLIEFGVGAGPDRGQIQLKAGPTGFALRSASRSIRLELLLPVREGWPDRYAASAVQCWPDTSKKSMRIDLPWIEGGRTMRGAA